MTHVTMQKIWFIAFMTAVCLSGVYSHKAQAQVSGPGPGNHAQAAQSATAAADNDSLFSLERCIDIALTSNPEIAAAKWDILAGPGGYEVFYGGQAQMMRDMTRSATMILGFALFFAFAVLAVQFNSLKLPALVLSVIPFCLAGTVAALFLAAIPMGATLIIGILVVIALTVNQGVLLVTFAESLKADDRLTTEEAIIAAAKIRLRPVLMLSFCFIAGLIPLALNIEEGGDMLQPMAVGAIGGLAVGVMVTLFLLPSLYLIFTGKRTEQEGEPIVESAG